MILVCGENVIDFIPSEEKKEYFKACIGGSPLNTALSLGRLNQKVYFFSRISNDFFGEKIINFLNKNNVNTSLVQRTDDLTAVAIVSDKKNPQFSFHAAQTADRNINEYSLDNDFRDNLSLAHFSSISLVLEPGSETYFKMMKDLQKKSLISIDPNIRESLIPNKNFYIDRFKQFLTIADIIKLSDEDFEYFASLKDKDSIIKEWILNNKVSVIILTQGPIGVTLYTKKYKISIKSIKTKVVDTIGAGDSFQAGVISWLMNNNFIFKNKLKILDKTEWKSCLDYANKIASFCCMKEGCDPPFEKDLT